MENRKVDGGGQERRETRRSRKTKEKVISCHMDGVVPTGIGKCGIEANRNTNTPPEKRVTKFKVQSSLDKHKVSLRNKWLSMFFFLVTFFSTLCSSAPLTLSVSVFFRGADSYTRLEHQRGEKVSR